jgi:Tfp pilus assembly protein PilF
MRLLRLAFGAAADSAGRLAAGFAALYFAIHPLRVESVAWVTERRDVLSGLFLLATMVFYLRAATTEEGSTRRRRSMILAVIFYAFSLLAKAAGITLPVVLLVLDVYLLKRLPGAPGKWVEKRFHHVWLEKIPFLLLALGVGIVALAAQRLSGALVAVHSYGLARRLGQAMYALAFYPWKTIAPTNLSPLYQVPFSLDGWTSIFLLSGLAVLVTTAALIMARKTFPGGLAAWISYVAIVVPVLGVAQSGVQLVADRYSYLSCLSWAVLAGAALYYFWLNYHVRKQSSIFVSAVVILILLGFGIMTWKQTQIWHDSGTLWRHAVAVAPDSSIARYNLALVLENEGDFDSAIEKYRGAVTLDPAYAEAHYNLGRILARQGRLVEAIAEYRNALLADSRDPDAHNNLALLLIKQGEWPEAIEQLRQTLQIDPKHARAHYNLGRILARQGDLDGAVSHFKQALETEPGVAEIHENLARALLQQGKHEEAVRHYEEAVRIMKLGGGR